jgi:Tfp pilus assembly protein PilO
VKGGLPKPAAIALVVVALLAVTVLGYFVLISPQRSKSADLAMEAEAIESQIQTLRITNAQVRNVEPIRVADLFYVGKAMPDNDDMPSVLLELNRIARDTGIRFESITPQDAVDVGGYLRRPIDLVFDGNFYELSDFLYRLRSLVRVRGGQLEATGRLFTVNSLNFAESEHDFPRIKATLNIAAYVYGTGATAPATPAAPPSAPQPPAPAEPQPSPSPPSPQPAGASATGAP